MRTPTHILARLALWPLSVAYRTAVRLRVSAYERGWARTERIEVPVISIGNLSVGGTGKTPIVELVCRLIADAGMRVAVVSRGYKRRGGEPVTVVSRGDGSGPAVDVAAAGDEPYLMAHTLPHTAVVVSPDRVAGACLAVRDLGAQVIVADDAYQHLRLARDVNILVIDATNPTEAGWLLPAGRLREPLDAARRAAAFLVTRCDRIGETKQMEGIFRAQNPTAPFFHSIARAVEVQLPDGGSEPPQALMGRTVAAFCGIGRPGLFLQDLERAGARVAAFLPFPDHHWFTDADLRRVADRAAEVGATAIITTEKDYARLSEAQRESLPLCRLTIQAEIWEERRFLKFLLGQLTREVAA